MKNIVFQLAELCPHELNAVELTMLELLCDAHEAAAKANKSASNQIAGFMGSADVDLKSAFIGALAIIGGKHAPIQRIREFLHSTKASVTSTELDDKIISALADRALPGWGNSFYKDGPDPAIAEIAKCVERNRVEWHNEIEYITTIAHEKGKVIYPNIGCYTAVVAEIIGFPSGAELALVVLPRLATWTKLYLEARNK